MFRSWINFKFWSKKTLELSEHHALWKVRNGPRYSVYSDAIFWSWTYFCNSIRIQNISILIVVSVSKRMGFLHKLSGVPTGFWKCMNLQICSRIQSGTLCWRGRVISHTAIEWKLFPVKMVSTVKSKPCSVVSIPSGHMLPKARVVNWPWTRAWLGFFATFAALMFNFVNWDDIGDSYCSLYDEVREISTQPAYGYRLNSSVLQLRLL